MNFPLFLLLNAVLLIRPEELYPEEIAGLRLFAIVIVPCILSSLPGLARQLSAEGLRARPVSVCVLVFYVNSLVSLFVLGRQEEALFEFGPEFGKVILYYFLLLAIVDTRERFRAFVATLVCLIVILVGIALAQHYGYVNFPNIIPVLQREQDADGNDFYFNRLTSTGIFGDPNDLCLILGLGNLCCLYLFVTGGGARLLWLAPIPVFVFALLETASRGGLLGVLAGVAAYLFSRFGGGAKSTPVAVAVVVAGIAVVGGRQGAFGGGGTAHERVMMWAEGLRDLFNRPILLPTGLGRGFYVSDEGLEAHNSFVQAYVEMGIIGGGAFLAIFYLSVRHVSRLGRVLVVPPWVVQARHFGFAVVVGYAMGCYSITRNFVIPTYLAVGLAGVLLDQASWTLPERYRVTQRWWLRMAVLAVVGLLVVKYMTMGLSNAGV